MVDLEKFLACVGVGFVVLAKDRFEGCQDTGLPVDQCAIDIEREEFEVDEFGHGMWMRLENRGLPGKILLDLIYIQEHTPFA